MLRAFGAKKYCGKQVGGYSVISRVGEGRYGTCYLARPAGGADFVILKRFKPGIFKANRQKNAYEAVLLSQLQHGSIPALLGVVRQKGFYGFVLERKPGHTLEELLFAQKRVFGEPEIFQIGLQLLHIIRYLHENGVVHRDIRCANVLYDGRQVSLVDFGLARWMNGNRYRAEVDFSYFGNLLLFLLYSSFQKIGHKNLPWHEELPLPAEQKGFLKRLLLLEPPFKEVSGVENAFLCAFGPGQDTSAIETDET